MSIITLHKDTAPNPANLIWEAPPARPKQGKYAQVSEALRARPNEWAIIATKPTSQEKGIRGMAQHIRTGKYIDFRTTDGAKFETATRTSDGTVRLYVRYIPPAQAGVISHVS